MGRVSDSRCHWSLLVVAGSAVGLGLAMASEPVGAGFRWLQLGLLAATTVTALAAMVRMAPGSRHLGAMGDAATARVLLGDGRRRPGWHLVPFPHLGPAERVLVGPGGVWAVTSRYLVGPCTVTAGGLGGPAGRDPLRRAGAGSSRVARHLRRHDCSLPVRAVVVLWGPGAPMLPGGKVAVGDVTVCEGRRSGSWLDHVLCGDLPSTTVESVLAALQGRRDGQAEAAPLLRIA